MNNAFTALKFRPEDLVRFKKTLNEVTPVSYQKRHFMSCRMSPYSLEDRADFSKLLWCHVYSGHRDFMREYYVIQSFKSMNTGFSGYAFNFVVIEPVDEDESGLVMVCYEHDLERVNL